MLLSQAHPPERTSRDLTEVPADDLLLTPSCILGAANPATEILITKIYDLLGLNWRMPFTEGAACTCCSGILAHGDVITFESTLLVVARLWSIAAELGLGNVSTACVTSFGLHHECLEMLHQEEGLDRRLDGWLRQVCGKPLTIPDRVVHASDVVWRHRHALGERMPHRLVDHRTGRKLRVVDHVGCHYAKLFPEKALGGADRCEVLTGMIEAWGGATVDYPERTHCCGMGFRQSMLRPNRGYTMACVLRKLESMEPFQPDLILTNCPGCNVFLDKEQWAAQALTGKRWDIPTLSYAELSGLLLGWDPYDVVGIQAHTTKVEPLLEQIGISYDPERARLTSATVERRKA